MDTEKLIDDLIYSNYKFNRERSPGVSAERWAKIFTCGAELEERYQKELARRVPADVQEFARSPEMQAEVEVGGVIADCHAAVDAVERQDFQGRTFSSRNPEGKMSEEESASVLSPIDQALGKGALQRHQEWRGGCERED